MGKLRELGMIGLMLGSAIVPMEEGISIVEESTPNEESDFEFKGGVITGNVGTSNTGEETVYASTIRWDLLSDPM